MSDLLHHCPGGCGNAVPKNLFACRQCWYLLPFELRKEITYSHTQAEWWKKTHRRAMARALEGYRKLRTDPHGLTNE